MFLCIKDGPALYVKVNLNGEKLGCVQSPVEMPVIAASFLLIELNEGKLNFPR
jgi:hypothetical protein